MLIKISNIPIQVNSNIKLANFDLFHTDEVPLYIIDRGTSSKLIHQRYEKDQLMYELFFDGVDKYTYLIHSKDLNRSDEIEYVASLDLISYILLKSKHYILHASAFVYEDKGILLSGKSGIGKTTLANRFSKELSFKWINDDKPIIQMTQQGPYVFSSPWMGKDQLGEHHSAKINVIYFLEQGSTDQVSELKSIEKIIYLRENINWIASNKHVNDTLVFIELLINHVHIFRMTCTNSKNAYKVLKEHLQQTS